MTRLLDVVLVIIYLRCTAICGADALIKTLSERSWPDILQSKQNTVIEIYSDWCVGCPELRKEFRAAAKSTAAFLADSIDVDGVSFAELRVSSGSSIIAEWDLNTLPVIAIVKDKGKSIAKYHGERTVRQLNNNGVNLRFDICLASL